MRSSRYFMRARQRIYRKGPGRISIKTGARLFFKYIPGQRRYWKFDHAARFELWRIDALGRRTRRVKVGPKVSYCLRDLRRTRPGRRFSPRRLAYPACSVNSGQRRVTLGTSVGWSDIYPPTYPEQWIDVTGFRGCFAFRHMADPRNGIYESKETQQLGVRGRAAALQAGEPALSGSPLACAGPHARSAGHALPLLRLRPACPPPAYP